MYVCEDGAGDGIFCHSLTTKSDAGELALVRSDGELGWLVRGIPVAMMLLLLSNRVHRRVGSKPPLLIGADGTIVHPADVAGLRQTILPSSLSNPQS